MIPLFLTAILSGGNDKHAEFEAEALPHMDLLYNFAVRTTGDPDDAKDLLQETFLKVYDNLEKFRGEAHLSTWIYRIAMNEALMRIRKDKNRAFSLDTFHAAEDQHRELEVEDWSPLPLERLLTRELGGKLEGAISLLTEDYRAVFLLRDVEGLSNEEIARVMKLSVPAVKSRIHRAPRGITAVPAEACDSGRLQAAEQAPDASAGCIEHVERGRAGTGKAVFDHHVSSGGIRPDRRQVYDRGQLRGPCARDLLGSEHGKA